MIQDDEEPLDLCVRVSVDQLDKTEIVTDDKVQLHMHSDMSKYKTENIQLYRDVLNHVDAEIATSDKVQFHSDATAIPSRNISYFNESSDQLNKLLDDAVVCEVADLGVLSKIIDDNGVITNDYGVRFHCPRSAIELAPVLKNEKFAVEVIFNEDGQATFALPNLEKARTSSIDPNKVVKNISLPVLTNIKGDSKELLVLKQAVVNKSPSIIDDWPLDDCELDIPSTQQLMKSSVSFGAVPKIKRELSVEVEQAVVNKSPSIIDDWPLDDFELDIPSTQQLMKSAVSFGAVPKIKRELSVEVEQAVVNKSPSIIDDWPLDDFELDIPSTQQLMKSAVSFGAVPKIKRELSVEVEQAVVNKSPSIIDDWPLDDFELDIPSTQQLMKSAVSFGAVPKMKRELSIEVEQEIADQYCSQKIRANNRPRSEWIDSTVFYTMSDMIFNYIFDEKKQKIDKTKFLYRKDSIGRELDLVFPGCVIYVDTYYEGTKKPFWRLQAYCSHLKCRNYRLIAQYDNPTVFQVFVDAQEVCHTQTVARQLRRYERDQEKKQLKNKMPTSLRVKSINETEDQLIKDGNYQEVVSIDVLNKARSEATSEQDIESDDVADVEAMQTKDVATNFISKVLARCNFGVYIHAKNQHTVLHMLHVKRSKDGVPIVVRMDATGNIARPIDDVIGQLLYYAMTINLTILHDKKSTALPLTEQFNVRHKSEDISLWLCDFILAHNSFYENPPLLLDFMISDFSYANFHSILFAFNNQTLQRYLIVCYNFIIYKIENGEFPDEFNEIVKIMMCYTHVMHTFGDMTKRHFGKSKFNGQLQESRVILETLAAIIKATEYNVILQLFQQMVILLSNEYKNSEVENAAVQIKKITRPLEADLDLDSEDNLHTPIDLDDLPENCPTLYKNNLFYLEFQKIVDNTENFFEEVQEKNKFYNPGFLQKFMTRFVPLIPLWSSLLKIDKMEPPNSELFLLQGRHNQPIETYFGMFKKSLYQQAVNLGTPPVKIGRALTLSRSITDATVKSIQLVIPKTRLNTQNPRKPYQKKCTKNVLDSMNDADKTNFPSGDGAGQIDPIHVNDASQIESIPPNSPGQIDHIHVNGASQIESIPPNSPGQIDHIHVNGASQIESIPPNSPGQIDHIHVNGASQIESIPPNGPGQIDPIYANGASQIESVPLESADTTFGSAKEQYKKRRKSNFNYFQMRTVSKMSAATVSKKAAQQKPDKHQDVATESHKLEIYQTNGLYMDSNIYSNLQDIEIIVASKAGMMLNNKTFATLNPSTSISSKLMSYVIMTLPKRIQVEFETTKNILHNRSAITFKKTVVFLILLEKDHFVLFIIDAKKKSFAMLDPKPKRNQFKKRMDYFKNFLSCIQKYNKKWSTYQWQQIDYEIDIMSDDDNCNSGIYVIHYMFEYLKHSTVQKSNVSTKTLRQNLKEKIIKESDNMKKTCVQCGTKAGGRWGNCTVCDRWTHAKCQDIDIKVIAKQHDYKCIICSQF